MWLVHEKYYANCETERELVLAQIRDRLFQVAVAAEDKLQGRTFNELLGEGNLAYYPHDYQVAFLNKKLQPTITYMNHALEKILSARNATCAAPS
ncbi:hypothetical protein [Effusibacillus pohliae]|uniref:hypothetical protein n=1 Tax=Effusibacillus pohliae TaxID=232270 RepID=UPI000370A274|nr:hypothetical protein [Effusibacillus pohliae]